MSDKDFYTLLEVSANCSDSDLKKSYKKLARKYHPDNKETGDENLFKQIGEAYSVLSDPQKRSYYDRVGHAGFVSGGAGRGGSAYGNAEMFSDLQDVFDSFFGAGFSSGSSRKSRKTRERGSDLQVAIDLDFLEAAFGGPKKVSVTRLVNCQTCAGSGADPGTGLKSCTSCQGTGEIKRVTQSFLGVITQVSACPTCQGTGSIIPVPCKVCHGKGRTKDTAELEVKIPKGVEDGSRLVWSQKGNEGRNGGPAGDLYLLLRVKPHARFKREKLDIYEEVEIDVWQAMLGDTLEVETIHGSQTVDVKPGLQPGTVLSLNSQGIKLDNGQSGSHHIRFTVKIPHKKDLPKELINLIKEEIMHEEKQSASGFANLFKLNKNKE
jgi:molecular chaperone DnaJ